jgi:hypothetical protein
VLVVVLRPRESRCLRSNKLTAQNSRGKSASFLAAKARSMYEDEDDFQTSDSDVNARLHFPLHLRFADSPCRDRCRAINVMLDLER